MEKLVNFILDFQLLDHIPVPLQTLLLLFLFVKAIDFATGILKTYKDPNSRYRSAKMRDGIFHFTGELLAISFVMAFDVVLGLSFYLTGATISLFVYKEAGSVLENLAQIGVKLPSQIQDHLEVLNKEDGDDK